MKILLVVTKGGAGGAQVFVADLARSLYERGHEVVVAAGAGDFLSAELRRRHIPFECLASFSRKIGLRSMFRFALEIRRLADHCRPDVIHFNSSHTLLGARFIKRHFGRPKLLFTMHGLSVLDPNYEQSAVKKFLFRLFFKFFLRHLDRVVYICRRNAADGLYLTKIAARLIYNGIDSGSGFSDRQAARREISRLAGRDLDGRFIMASIGRLAYQKNYEFLIKNWPAVLRINPASCLVIFGQGEKREKLTALIKKYHLEEDVFIVDLAPASPYLAGADFYLQPSRFEGLPYSIFEAMRAGLPILAADVGGVKEILVDPCQVYEPNNERMFLDKLRSALSKKEESAEVIKENHRRLKSFSLDKMAEE